MDFPLSLSTQLKQHLRSLRKTRGLTQAGLAQLLGVGQSRVADIEADPGTVSLDQLLKVLAALDAELVLRDKQPGSGVASGASALPSATGFTSATAVTDGPPLPAADPGGSLPDEPRGAW